MPLVRIIGWQRGLRPNLPPAPLITLFIKETEMDGSDAEAAVRRLTKGKFVDTPFDVGEEEAAETFIGKVKEFGLSAKLYPDETLSWSRPRTRPLFLISSLAVLVGFGAWLWAFAEGIDSPICRTVSIVYGLLIICWLYYGSGGISAIRPETQAQKARRWKQRVRWRFGLFAAVVLIGVIFHEPLYGLVLLLVAVGGIGCALLIRLMNRN